MITDNSTHLTLPNTRDKLQHIIGSVKQDLAVENDLAIKLCEENQILEIVSELTSDYFFQLSVDDGSFSIDWIKGKFEEITGYPKSLITDLQKWILCIHPDDVDIINNATANVLSNQRSVTEYRFKSKSGAIKWLRDYTCPVWDEKQKRVTKIIGAVKDVTDTKEAEEKLLNYSNKLKSINSSKDKLFSVIAHDLREPFTGIVGNLELLSESILSFPLEESRDMIQDALKCAKDAYSLLENLLEWSRIQTGKSKVNITDFNLLFVVDSALKIFSSLISNKKINIINIIDENLNVRADEYMTFSVFRNLISNAVKFSNAKGKIIISSKSEKDFVKICVEDSGIGISNENLIRLFCTDTHYSTPGTENEKGTGLGLILCKEFVEKNGGKIWVESEIGKGSRFCFTLRTTRKL